MNESDIILTKFEQLGQSNKKVITNNIVISKYFLLLTIRLHRGRGDTLEKKTVIYIYIYAGSKSIIFEMSKIYIYAGSNF